MTREATQESNIDSLTRNALDTAGEMGAVRRTRDEADEEKTDGFNAEHTPDSQA